MRLYSNTLTMSDIQDALDDERFSGRIAGTVGFKIVSEHRSTTHKRAFEVQLESWGKVNGDGRRYGNSGSYGAGENWTATYDEWGWFLAALYRKDWAMVCGSVKHPVYDSVDHFNERTAFTYAGKDMLEQLERGERHGDHGDPYPYVRKGAVKIGRHGAARDDGTAAYRWPSIFAYWPRTAAEYRKFAHLDTAKASA